MKSCIMEKFIVAKSFGAASEKLLLHVDDVRCETSPANTPGAVSVMVPKAMAAVPAFAKSSAVTVLSLMSSLNVMV